MNMLQRACPLKFRVGFALLAPMALLSTLSAWHGPLQAQELVVATVNNGPITAGAAATTIIQNGAFTFNGPVNLTAGRLTTNNVPAATTTGFNAPLTAAPGTTLALGGDWDSAAAINTTAATVELHGSMTLADVAGLRPNGGTVEIHGALDLGGGTLSLDGTGGTGGHPGERP